MKAVLSLNAGSSSIKFALFGVGAQNALQCVCRGAVEETGAAPRFVVRGADDRELECQSWPEHRSDFHFLARQVLDSIDGHLGASTAPYLRHDAGMSVIRRVSRLRRGGIYQ
jgi:acetate kinase